MRDFGDIRSADFLSKHVVQKEITLGELAIIFEIRARIGWEGPDSKVVGEATKAWTLVFFPTEKGLDGWGHLLI